MNLLPVYLRKIRAPGHPSAFDVLVFRDPAEAKLLCRFNWWHGRRPTKRTKQLTLNCFRWQVIWLS